MPKFQRAKTARDIYAKKRNILELTGQWKAHIGQPEIKGTWFIYGHSGHGKTSYITQMARELATFGRVWYNGREEGDSYSFQRALERVGMAAIGNMFLLIEDSYEQLMARLKRRNRPMFLIVDSLQVMQLNKAQYHELENCCEEKGIQLIIIGHAEGKRPEGRIGKYIEYLSFIKIWVWGYKAIPKSRYGGNEPFVIYAKRAAEFYGDIS